MDFLNARRVPCAVCGLDTPLRSGWYVVGENRWLDRLRVFRWNVSLAGRGGYQSVCGREDLKTLIACWFDQDRFRLLFRQGKPVPIAGNPGYDDLETEARSSRYLVGELSIFREPFSREWTGSPEALEAMVEAMIPAAADMPGEMPTTLRFYSRPRLQESRLGLSSP